MKFYLIVANGPKQGLPINVGIDLFMLGSDPMCQLRAPVLAPKHCAFITRDKRVFLRDFDGGQPTYLNTKMVPAGAEWPLHAGDVIAVGPLEFMIQFHEKALSRKDLEEWAASCLDNQSKRNVLEDADAGPAHNAQEAAAQMIDRLNLLKGVVQGRLRVAREKGFVIVRFNDTHIVDEAEIAHLKRELCDTLDKPNLRIVLDFKNVRRLSANGVIMLREFRHWLGPRGGVFSVCRVRDEIRSVITTLLGNEIAMFSDKSTAMAGKW